MNRVLTTVLALILGAVSLPSRAGVQEAGNDIYRVAMNENPAPPPWRLPGGYSAWTGRDHPVTPLVGRAAEILEVGEFAFGTSAGSGGDFNFIVVRSYDSGRDYVLIVNPYYDLVPSLGFECVRFAEPGEPAVATVMLDGETRGVRATWHLASPPDDLLVEHALIVHGSDVIDSSIEDTVRIVNLASGAARVGLRGVWAPIIDSPGTATWPHGRADAGDYLVGLRPPDPPLEPRINLESEWASPGFRMFELTVNPRAYPDPDRYTIAGLVSSTLGVAVTRPDLIQSASLDPLSLIPLGGMSGACFDWTLPLPARTEAASGGHMAIASYWGLTPDTARVVSPGADVAFTQHVVAFREYPIAASTTGPYLADCQGAVSAVPVGGRTELTAPTAGEILARWTSSDPRVSFVDPTAAITDAVVDGIGTVDITFTTSVGVYQASQTTTLTVTDIEAPRFAMLTARPASLWQPNHRLVRVDVAAVIADDCDPAPQLRLISVTSNETERAPGSGATLADIQDAAVGTDDRSVLLRAERTGRGDGRTYTLTYAVTDWAGNRSTQDVEVRVLHDLRRRR